jgi:hypothetical protein
MNKSQKIYKFGAQQFMKSMQQIGTCIDSRHVVTLKMPFLPEILSDSSGHSPLWRKSIQIGIFRDRRIQGEKNK